MTNAQKTLATLSAKNGAKIQAFYHENGFEKTREVFGVFYYEWSDCYCCPIPDNAVWGDSTMEYDEHGQYVTTNYEWFEV